jgi:mRNA interferase MazF
MSIKYYPEQGTILICDFQGMKEPEMVKRRPVVVVSPKLKNRGGLCTIVPLSTTNPRPIAEYHYMLKMDNLLPTPYDASFHWVKCDMLYTVSFERLHLPFIGKDEFGKRQYDIRVVSDKQILDIQNCIKFYLDLK